MSVSVFVSSTGEKIPVVIETRRGMCNITLRPKIQPAHEIHISKPWLVSVNTALRFMESKRCWIEKVFALAPTKHKVCPGECIEFLGRRVCLVHDKTRHANKFLEDSDGNFVLVVGGGIEMFERRVREFVKAQFLVAVKEIIRTTPREFWPARIAIRDTASRWGSCSSSGTMSFSWRLAFAPVDVMRYVVMHELAHKKHMNHSPEFWHQVSELYGFGVDRARRWLKIHGCELHQYF